MTFPIINDYRNAMSNASKRFASLKVKPVLDANGEPVFFAGNFAAVFKATVQPDDQLVAIKLFIRDLPELEQRHRAITEAIEKLDARYLIDIGFMPNELYVTSKIAGNGEFPLVVMPWTEGRSLGNVVEMLCNRGNQKGLAAMTKAWANLSLSLLAKGISHGDLKHDNVLVTNDGQLRLIDYDSMFVPQLKGLKSTLLGGASYQHPLRNITHFNAQLDHFSILVILLSLRALTLDPSLYEAFNTGENLIFTHDDFVAAFPTKLQERLLASPDALVRKWTAQLIKVAASSSLQVPRLKKILQEARKTTLEPSSASRGFSLPMSRQQAVA